MTCAFFWPSIYFSAPSWLLFFMLVWAMTLITVASFLNRLSLAVRNWSSLETFSS